MIFKIISYLFLLIYTLIYTINNYSDISCIIGNSLLILLIFGLIFYHYDWSLKNKKIIVISLLLSFLCSLFTFGQLARSYKQDEIFIENISDGIVTIDAIYLDDSKQKINQEYFSEYDRFNSATKKTNYQQYNKIDEDYKGTLKTNESYIVNIKKKKNVIIELQRNTIDYSILINGKKITVEKFDHPLNEKSNKIYNSNYKFEYSNVNRNVSWWKKIIILTISTFVYFNIFIRIFGNKKGILLLLPVLLIEINPYINVDLLTKIIFLLIYLLFILKYDQEWNFKNKKQKILIAIISIYLSFSFIGNNLLEDFVSIKFICIFLLFCLWFYNLFPFIFNFLHKIKIKNQNKKISNKQIILHRIIVFTIIVLIGLLYQLAFNPYIVPPDGYMQLQDINNNSLSNWHPYMHTLLLKLFVIIFGDVKFFILFRIFVFAIIFTNILFYFYKKNLSLVKIYIIAILFTALPVTGILLVTIYKDVDFSIALLSLTFFIFLILKDFEYFNKNKFNYLWLILSMIGVGLFRHNGMIILFLTSFFLIFTKLPKKNFVIASVLISCFIAFLSQTTIYDKLKVQDAPSNFDVATMLHGINRLVYKNNSKLDSQAKQYLFNIMPEDSWKLSYDKYNIDLLLHYQLVDIRNGDINKKKLINLYLKQFTKTPIELIKDRLYGIDLIWNVSEKDEVMTYKYQYLYDEFETNYSKELKIKYNENILTKLCSGALLFIAKNEVLNSLFFRVGIYIDIILIIIAYCILTNQKKLFYCLFPMAINIITLALAMHHYEYRYVWNIELVFLLFILIFIFGKKSEK